LDVNNPEYSALAGDLSPVDSTPTDRQAFPHQWPQWPKKRKGNDHEWEKINPPDSFDRPAGISTASILHRPADAAEFSRKYGGVLPVRHPMNARMAETAPKFKEVSNPGPCREMACESGSYIEIKKRMGDEIRALPEKHTGPSA
jgi:hypothetical protein